MDTLFTSFLGCGVQTANMTELGTADNRFHQRFDVVVVFLEHLLHFRQERLIR